MFSDLQTSQMENLMENVRDVSHEIEDSLYLFMTIIDII